MHTRIEYPSPQTRVVPITFQQQFYLHARENNNSLDLIGTVTLRLSGNARVDLLLESFAEVIRRHDALRTRMIAVEGILMQEIAGIADRQLRTVEVCDSTSDENERRAQQYLTEFREKRCDPRVGPLFYVEILKVADTQHYLSYAIHHLISDGTSIDIIFREVWSRYSALLRGLPAPPSRNAVQYSDYAIWQHQTDTFWREKHDSYWHSRLDRAPRVRWPHDGATAGLRTCGTALARARFEASPISRLRELASREQTLLSIVLLGVYVVVVSAWCRQLDFVVAMNVGGRDRAEEAGTVGYLGYYLYLRTELLGDETFIEVLSKVGREFHRALSHQDSGRMATKSPDLLAGTSFAWMPWQREETYGVPTQSESSTLDMAVELFPAAPHDQIVNFEPVEPTRWPPLLFEMGVQFTEDAAGVAATLIYRAELFSANLAERLLKDVLSTAQKLARNPYCRISKIIPNGA